jgi:signal transduction histidine kinase
VRHADPAKSDIARGLLAYPPDLSLPEGTPRVLRSGTSSLAVEVTDEMLQALAQDAEHLRLVRALAPVSWMLVPLVARGRTVGSITFLSCESGRRYGPEDLALGDELGRRTGLAVDNARLYEAEQDARAEAEAANQAKDQFVAMVSHELRNPLNSTTAALFLLRRGMPPDDTPRQRAIEIVERNVALQARLVNDLLDLSRLQRGKLSLQQAPTRLDRVVETAARSQEATAREAGLTLTWSIEPELWVQGDADRLQQVVMNLLTNAIKFTPPPGEIRVRCEASHTEQVRLVVEDTGIGISPELLPHLFEMFRQGEVASQRAAGLGLGLALVKGIVERHGGQVWAESDGVGKGSRFIVELPRVSAPAAADARRASPGTS